MVVLFLFLVLIALILNFEDNSYLSNITNSAILLEGICTMIIGWLLIRNTIGKANDKYIQNKFLKCFLLCFFVSLIYIHFTWIPYMKENFGIQAFDPIRYYYGANDLARYGTTDAYMNYFGVSYFYAFFMRILGISPLIPLFINILLTLYASLILFVFLKKDNYETKNTLFPYILLIPEVMCYNALSSREIICMACLTIIVVKVFELLKHFQTSKLIISLFFFLLLIIVRPPFGLLALLCVGFYFIILSKKKVIAITFSVILLGIMFIGSNVTSGLGDSTDAMTEQLDVSQKRQVDSEVASSQNSLSARLTPHNSIEFFVYGVIRSVAYLLISPGQLANPYNSFFNFNNISPTDIYVGWTTIFMMLSIPVLYRTYRKIRLQNEKIKYLLICLVLCLYVVGTFMASFIHLRYRIVYDLLYFGVVLYLLSFKQKKYIQ